MTLSQVIGGRLTDESGIPVDSSCRRTLLRRWKKIPCSVLKKANPSQDGDAKPPFLTTILQESGAAEALESLLL
jgi:hypothetical protein